MYSYSKYLVVCIGLAIPVLGAGGIPQEDPKPETRTSAVSKDEEDSTPVANDDEVRLLVDCLKRFEVFDLYIRIDGDITKIPAGNEVYVSRIDDAIRVFNRLVREKETSDRPTTAKGSRD